MRAFFGLLCWLFLTATPVPGGDALARLERVAAVGALLTEIASESRDDADGLPEDLADAVDRWTNQIDHL